MEDFIKQFTSSDNLFTIHHSYSECPSNSNFALHKHKTYEIYCFISGSVGHYIEGNHYPLSPDDILIMNHTELHHLKVYEDTPYERIVLELSEEIVEPFKNAVNFFSCFNDRPLGRNNLFPGVVVQQYQLINYVKQIVTYCEKGGPENEVLSKCEIIRLLIQLNKASIMARSDTALKPELHPQVDALIHYINNNLTADLSLDALADRFFLTKYYLCHIFKDYTGFTLNQYISMKRVIYANSLITNGYTITNACYAAGFNDYSNFYKTYKKFMNHAPKDAKTKLSV